MRRLLGFLLYAAGGLMVSFSAARYVVGLVAAQHARDAWDGARSVSGVRPAAGDERRGVLADGSPVARLVIPGIDLDEIVLEGSDELNAGPGHVTGTALPGESGNAIIAGERERAFNHLDALAAGDTIVTESGRGRDTWVVVGKRVVGSGEHVAVRPSNSTLTLTTSWPIRYLGPAPERLVVTAARVERPSVRVAAGN